MRKITRLTGAIAALIAFAPSLQAYDFASDGFFFNILDESFAEEEHIMAPIGEDGEWGVPKCVEITYDPEKHAWRQSSYSGDIQLPLKVTYEGVDYYIAAIGEEAFRFSDALTSVTLPMATEYFSEGGCLSYIKPYAFANSGIKSFNGSTQNIKEIGESAFANSKIESFICYNGTRLGSFVFSSSAIKEFSYILSSDHEFDIPEGAFLNCTNLKDVSGLSVESIGLSAFEGCAQLTHGIEAKYIGSCAFRGCTSLSRYRFFTTKYVGERAFENCTALDDVDFVSSSVPLEFASGLYVFNGCTSLKEITIDRKFVVDYDSMEECNPFEGCPVEKITFRDFGLSFDMTGVSFSELKEIKCATLIPPHIGTLTPAQYRNIKVTVPKQVYTKYTSSPYWKDFVSLTAYEDYDNLSVVEVNGTYYYAGAVVKNPFGNYKGRIELVNEYSVNGKQYKVFSIGEEAFYNCRNLTEVVFPADCGISIFESYAFARSGIREIDLSYLDNLDQNVNSTGIRDYIFWDCSDLAKVTLPTNLKSIPKGCFQDCVNLKTTNWSENIQVIGDFAFYRCSSLGNGTIDLSNLPKNLYIRKSAFEGCNLKDVTFPNAGDVNINREAFAKNKLSKIDIPQGSYIEERAFADNLLSEVTLRNRTSIQGEMIADGNDNVAVVKADQVYSHLYEEDCNWFSMGHVGKVIIEGYNYDLEWNWKTWNVDIIEVHLNFPARLDDFTEEQYEKVIVYVPLNAYETYRTAPIWEKFKNLRGVDYASLNSVYDNFDINIEVIDNQIIVSNTKAGSHIYVYSIDGKQVAAIKADEDVTTINHLPSGIYLVAVSGYSPTKVVVR